MTLPDIINQFNFPPEALEDFQRLGLTQKRINQGGGGVVSEFQLSGHDKGLGFRFLKVAIKNEMQSQETDMEINDEIVMIEWFKSKKERPVERVHMLPEALLKFRKVKNAQNQMVVKFPLECVGGAYKDDYARWKAGEETLGLELSRWNKVSIGQVRTLQSEGIFTVEQFANMDEDRVVGRFPKDLVKAYRDAIHFVKAQSNVASSKDFAGEILELKQSEAKLRAELSALKQQMEKSKTKTKKLSNKNNESKVNNEIELDEFELDDELGVLADD